jgi:sulfur-oxidizing protein SoxY
MGIIRHPTATRRIFMTGAGSLIGSLGVAPTFVLRPASATPTAMAAAIREVIGEATLQQGRVKLDIPPLVENGNTVSVTVSVDSPMSELDHVKSVHIFNEKNPEPNVTIFRLNPRAGRARVSTRIRLADSQKVVAIARLSDETFWYDSADVMVTLAACLEDLR